MLTEHDCKIAPSTCYAYRKRLQAPSARTVRDAELKPLIQQICEANYRVYGARKVWRELHRQGHIVARCTVERLVRERGVTGAVRGKKIIATTPDSTVERAPDLLVRNVVAPAPNRCWVADFTHISTWSGVVYVAFVVDIFSRRIVGWSAALSKEARLVLDALDMALWQRDRDEQPDQAGQLMHHSDAGSQYTSFRLAEHLDAAGIAASIGSVAWDGLTADPVRTGLHAIMPVLFIIGVGAARRLLLKAADIEDGTASDRIPLHRWALSPLATPRLYRRMRLAAVRSYPEMVAREQSLAGYEVWLRQKHGGDISKASETERLPMKMAPRGYTVEEALRLPEKWEADAQERQREEAERKRRKAEDERAQAERQRQQAKADRIAAIDDEGDVIEAKHRKEARTGTAAAQAEAAKVQAEFQKKAAERRALAELNAEESAEAAALRLKAADDNEKAAQAELRAAQIQAEAAQKAAEAERREQETEDRAARRIKEHQRQLEAEQKTAEAELHIARLKEQTARLEAAAQRAEDYARLSPRERNERRVARMIQSAGGDVDAVPLKDIMEELSIKQTAAGEVRAAAVELLKNGYQPDQILDSAQH
ncbi:IS3 family transposase [Streptomyces sp. NPDC017861]|uniref:IS3 family transposase n=1 Tax=unclassified Streptomyces TaxID=2593676 RepID=UPI00190ADFA3|nr:IS3 family transposase [Streptomyces sp. MBT51]